MNPILDARTSSPCLLSYLSFTLWNWIREPRQNERAYPLSIKYFGIGAKVSTSKLLLIPFIHSLIHWQFDATSSAAKLLTCIVHVWVINWLWFIYDKLTNDFVVFGLDRNTDADGDDSAKSCNVSEKYAPPWQQVFYAIDPGAPERHSALVDRRWL